MAGGIGYYEFIKDLVANYEEKKDEIAKNLAAVAAKVFTKDNFVLGLTADEEGRKILEENIESLFDRLPEAVEASAAEDILMQVLSIMVLMKCFVPYSAMVIFGTKSA